MSSFAADWDKLGLVWSSLCDSVSARIQNFNKSQKPQNSRLFRNCKTPSNELSALLQLIRILYDNLRTTFHCQYMTVAEYCYRRVSPLFQDWLSITIPWPKIMQIHNQLTLNQWQLWQSWKISIFPNFQGAPLAWYSMRRSANYSSRQEPQ